LVVTDFWIDCVCKTLTTDELNDIGKAGLPYAALNNALRQPEGRLNIKFPAILIIAPVITSMSTLCLRK
jgi:hypothetical protein